MSAELFRGGTREGLIHVKRRLALILVAILVLVGLFFVLRPRLPGGSAEARTIVVSMQAGTMTPAEIVVNEGDTVTLAITSDRDLEFHMHGYDLAAAIRPRTPTSLTFEATLTGRFDIEDEGAGTGLGALIVQPRGGR